MRTRMGLPAMADSGLFARLLGWFGWSPHTGSIEGRVYIDGRPAPDGTRVVAQFIIQNEEGGFTIPGEARVVSTRGDGRYRFRGIPAGEIGLGLLHWRGSTARIHLGDFSDVERRVEVREQECTFVDLGMGEGCVSGRLVPPEGYGKTVDWTRFPSIWRASSF